MNKNIKSTEKVELVYSGADYFLRLKDIIANAKTEIHFQTYIFDDDSTGKEIAEALKEAAARNVKVYVLLDGYGSSSLSGKFINDLNIHHINIRYFSPFFSANNFYLGRRLHHKVVVADGNITLIGGINIADKYHGTANEYPWLDYAVQVESKEIGAHLQQLCSNIYNKKIRIGKKKTQSIVQTKHDFYFRIIQNDWIKRKNEIFNAYIKSIRNSKREIIIVSSYFLPGRKFKNALKKASRKGVKIKLILSGISDVPIARRASCYLYSSLLKHNIELFEWNKSVLHGKAAVVDDKWATIGSFNLNHLSSYGSIEMNVEINSPTFSEHFSTHLKQVISQCEKITFETIKSKTGFNANIINWFSFHLMRTVLRIVTYLPYKRFAIFN